MCVLWSSFKEKVECVCLSFGTKAASIFVQVMENGVCLCVYMCVCVMTGAPEDTALLSGEK